MGPWLVLISLFTLNSVQATEDYNLAAPCGSPYWPNYKLIKAYPYFVYLKVEFYSDGDLVAKSCCSGTLLHHKLVVTSRLCFTYNGNINPKVTLIFATRDLRMKPIEQIVLDSPVEILPVSRNPQIEYGQDIAVLRIPKKYRRVLARKTKSKSINVASKAATDSLLKSNKTVWLIGYHFPRKLGKSRSRAFIRAPMRLLNSRDCKQRFIQQNETWYEEYDKTLLCTMYRGKGGQGTPGREYGGGLIEYNLRRDILHGIFSPPVDVVNNSVSRTSPTFFNRISPHKQWIEQLLKSDTSEQKSDPEFDTVSKRMR